MAKLRPGDASIITAPNGAQVRNPYNDTHYDLCNQMIETGAQAEGLFQLLEQSGLNIQDMRQECQLYTKQAADTKKVWFPMKP